MESFNIFQTGGREKFLKKKKEKKTKIETQNKQSVSVSIIQRNIQRFIQLKRARESLNKKMELQCQKDKVSQARGRLFVYWLLTPFDVRNLSLQSRLIQFWIGQVLSRNQIQFPFPCLLERMIGMTIEFLGEVFELQFKESLKICRFIFQRIRMSQFKISENQARSILNTLGKIEKFQTKKLIIQFLDTLLDNPHTKQMGVSMFNDEGLFLNYLLFKNQTFNKEKKNSASSIQGLVCACYPKILQKASRRMELENPSALSQSFQEISLLYNNILHHLQTTANLTSQTTLILMSFLNSLAQKMKASTLNEIISKYKINPKIFDSEPEYQQYLQQKDEYYILREEMMGEYEKTKAFLKKSIQIILQKKASLNGQVVYQQAFQFIYQLLNVLGDVDIIPLNKAITFFVENVNESMIYGLGKESFSPSFSLQSSPAESKFLLLLTLISKSAQQTPDLYFTKYYQSQEEKQILKKLIKQYLLKTLKHTMFLAHPTSTILKLTKTTTSVLQNLYNKIFRTNILPTQIFENTSFIMKFKNYEFKTTIKDDVSQFLVQFPYVFPLAMRAYKFKELLRRERQQYQPYMFHGNDSDSDDGYHGKNVKIRRNHEFVDAFEQLKQRNLRKSFRITFINQLGFEEKGIDAGGLKKEFLNRVLKDALNPSFGMFIQNSTHQLLPHPTKAQLNQGLETEYYEFIGKLIGLAIYSNITLGYKFSGTFLNAIVGKKNSFDDLKTIDPSLYKSLIYIKDMEEDAKELDLTFLYKDEIRNRLIQLLPNGHLINVTNENKKLYISLLTGYKVNRLLEHQARFIRKGLTQIINKEWLFMFNYQQLNYLISGQGQIDVDDLKYHTRIVGFEQNSITIKYFWEVVHELNEEQKSNLLMFVTACPRPSFLGFKQLSPPFTIACMKDKEEMLPISHTCSNVLQLPEYKSKQQLRKKLLTAIESNAGFQFG